MGIRNEDTMVKNDIEEREPLLVKESLQKKEADGHHSYTISSDVESSIGQNMDIESGFVSHAMESAVISGAHEIVLSWHKVDVFVSNTKKGWTKEEKPTAPKHILKSVSGIVKPGQLMAIMGASGAGKTTLLDVLTMRKQHNLTMTGLVLVNGHVVDPTTMTSISAYVQQDDLFIGTLTVREQLRFSALVRMHKSISYKQRMKRVQEVILELGLTKCADTLIGTPGRVKGISGGEMKRLAFASEVLTNPPLMFCDEPTSGLDSFMAQQVIGVLRNMAQRGKTIICTIHQPSSEIYTMFDSILLMAEGRPAYLGDTRHALDYFTSCGHPCPPNYNPADHFVQTLATIPGQEEVCRKRIGKICDIFTNTPAGKGLKQMDDLHEGKLMNVLDPARIQRKPYKAGWCAQFAAVFWRSALSIMREPMVVKMRLYQTLAIAIVLGLLYFQQTLTQHGVQNINGAIFLMLTNMTFQNYFGVINVFCLELPIFLREHWNGMYRTDVYFIAKTLAEVPLYLVIPFIFTTIMYWMVGLYPDPLKFLMALIIVTLVANCACSFGYMISCMSSSITMALSLGPPLITPLLLFGGFFLNNASIPPYFQWLQYLSWFKYSNEALNINQWIDVKDIDCTGTNLTCPTNGRDILHMYGFKEERIYLDLLYLFLMILGFRFIGYIALYIRARRKK